MPSEKFWSGMYFVWILLGMEFEKIWSVLLGMNFVKNRSLGKGSKLVFLWSDSNFLKKIFIVVNAKK